MLHRVLSQRSLQRGSLVDRVPHAYTMSFIFEVLQNAWSGATKDADKKDLANWQAVMDSQEKDRQRE